MNFYPYFMEVAKAYMNELRESFEREILGLDKRYIWVSWETKNGRKTRVRIEAKRRKS